MKTNLRKRTVGRPKLPAGQSKISVNLTLAPDLVAYAESIADGNRSAGVSRALEFHRLNVTQPAEVIP